MIWYLLVVLNIGFGATSQQFSFDSQTSCEAAQKKVQAAAPLRSLTICFEAEVPKVTSPSKP